MKKVITISTTALAVLSVFFISFSFINTGSVHAESSSTQASLEIDSIINISAPPTVTLNCTPGATDAQAELCTSTANVIVTTNNITGYTLQMNATSGSPTALTNSAASPAATIPTLSQAYPSANFPVNSWGYTGGTDKSEETGGYDCSTNYCPILAYNSDSSSYAPNHIINQTDAPSTASTTSITFAGKVNTTKPSGTYSTSVTFTAVTNAIPAPAMQDFDASSCAAMSTGDTTTLRDIRDNEEYLIGKLADNNCWMLDNMRLDLTNSTVLNSLTTANTNVDSASLTSLKSGNRAAGDRYASSGFATWAQGDTSSVYNQAKANADYKDTTTTSYGAGSGKIGVYYNYCAVSAGNYCYDSGAGVDDTSTLQDAQYDICPKHWRMPTSDTTGEYQALLTAYNNNQTATDSGSLQYNLSTPLSGLFYSGSAYGQGSDGYFWSSTWTNATHMRDLYVTSYVNPSSGYNRNGGFSVRCLLGS
ncbi:hypothetical protein IKF33_01200 [Candidatus Saccharibacteria bacterium]|nr:hypothetical protein [Candidatus Saccharibacteria bacterium]